jgi:hypothetical protein
MSFNHFGRSRHWLLSCVMGHLDWVHFGLLVYYVSGNHWQWAAWLWKETNCIRGIWLRMLWSIFEDKIYGREWEPEPKKGTTVSLHLRQLAWFMLSSLSSTWCSHVVEAQSKKYVKLFASSSIFHAQFMQWTLTQVSGQSNVWTMVSVDDGSDTYWGFGYPYPQSGPCLSWSTLERTTDT